MRTPSDLVERPALVGLLLLSMSAYLVVWSHRLGPLVRHADRRPLLLLADLCLSIFPAWATGGWQSPLLPFAFGALVLPGALFSWPGTIAAMLAYLVVDQVVGWNAWRPGTPVPLASPGGIFSYVRPLVAAALWPLSVELWRRSPRRRGLLTAPPVPAARPATSMATRLLPSSSARAGSPAEPPVGATTWSIARSQTLEHAAVLVDVRAAILQAVAEAEEQGLAVQLVIEGVEPLLPPGHVQVLTKAVEVGLDNVRRHAGAREAEVTLASEDTMILLTVRDHGNGLLDGTAEPAGFHQLKRLRYRVQELEGTVAVHDDEAGGVTLYVRIPRT